MKTWLGTTLALIGLAVSATASAVSVESWPGVDQSYRVGPGLGLAIPDNDLAGISSTISIDDDYTIGRMALVVALDHTYVGDLIFTLTGPDGTTITLADRPGSDDPADFGDSSNLSIAYPIVFGDLSPISAEDMGAGSCSSSESIIGLDCHRWLNPDTSLGGTFGGSSTFGDWTLSISDHAGQDLGTLDSWLIAFQYETVPVPPALWLFASSLFALVARRRAK